MHIGTRQSQLAILRVNRSVSRLRDRVIRIAIGARVFANHTRARVLLSGQMFELGDARETEIVGIIDDCRWLKSLAVEHRVLKFE